MEKSHLTLNSVFVFQMHDLQEKYRAAMHKKNIHNNIMVTKVTLDLNYGDILSISARYVRVGG